jgi:hypothetical protein
MLIQSHKKETPGSPTEIPAFLHNQLRDVNENSPDENRLTGVQDVAR